MLAAAPSTFVASVLPAAPSPSITPAGGSSFPITVSIVDSIAGSRVYYTTDGSTPTVSSSLFTAPFSISAPTTIKAIAVASGYANSAVESVGYGITNPGYSVKTVNVCEPLDTNPCQPFGVAVNPNTNTVYISNAADGATTSNPSPRAITIMDGITDTVSTFVQVPVKNPGYLVLNPATNEIYIGSAIYLSSGGPGLAALDVATNTSTSFNVNATATWLAINASTNKIYALSGTTLYLVDAVSGTVASISTGEDTASPGSTLIDVNPVTNHLFVGGNPNVLNIDGAANTVADAFAAAGSSVAVNPVTNKVYIAFGGSSPGGIVYDPVTLSTTLVSGIAGPGSIIVNPNTNTIYSLGSSSLQVIDGATNTVTTSVPSLGTTGVSKLILDPVLNKIYVLQGGSSGTSNLYVLDGATNTVSTVATGLTLGNIISAAINPVTHKLYITDLNTNVIVVTPN
jgi:DNA-binding beta-propeller fold protein YncE